MLSFTLQGKSFHTALSHDRSSSQETTPRQVQTPAQGTWNWPAITTTTAVNCWGDTTSSTNVNQHTKLRINAGPPY